MSNTDLKRSYADMRAGMHSNGNAVNGAITTRNQQQQAQQAHSQAQQARLQQQQRQAMLNGNAHGFAHNLSMQKKVYQFAESSEELLKKHEDVPPSLEFHIHENHYRFGNQDGIISKNNQMVKEFLEYVARGEIPHATVEVLRDAGIKFYEGCLILKLYDHRKCIEVKGEMVPRSYRTILRPTSLSLFYDLLYQSDSALQRFSDMVATGMETEILLLTNRNLDLKVPFNPYTATPYTRPATEYPIINENTGEILHNHRVECSDPRSKAFHPFKELHEESPQQNSEYEQFMLIMNDKNISEPSEASQFTRLRFVEQLRLNKEKMKQQSMNASLSNRSPMGAGTPNIANLTPQQQQMLQQRRLQQLQMQQMQKGGSVTQLQQQQQQMQQQKALAQQQLQQNMPAVESVADEDGKKNKKSKKAPVKKASKVVAGKTLPGYSDKTLPGMTPDDAPKKKRGTYKKKPKTESKP